MQINRPQTVLTWTNRSKMTCQLLTNNTLATIYFKSTCSLAALSVQILKLSICKLQVQFKKTHSLVHSEPRGGAKENTLLHFTLIYSTNIDIHAQSLTVSSREVEITLTYFKRFPASHITLCNMSI